MSKLLTIFTKTTPEIDEEATPGKEFSEQYDYTNTDFFFKVSILLADPTQEKVERQRAIAKALIEMEKPSHTFYELEIKFSTMRIGAERTDSADKRYRATLGVNTLINTWENIDPDELKTIK